jgi:hypothetical protein
VANPHVGDVANERLVDVRRDRGRARAGRLLVGFRVDQFVGEASERIVEVVRVVRLARLGVDDREDLLLAVVPARA